MLNRHPNWKAKGPEQADPGLEEEAEKRRRAEEEEARKEAATLFGELQERLEKKREEREKNLNADDSPVRKGTDTSIKKNSTFVKKLKTMTEQQRDSLAREVKTLNLTRYIEEAATSIGELKYKVADVGCVVRICSLIHQSYPDFAPKLVSELGKAFAEGLSKDEKPAHLTQYRIALRLIAELIVYGIFPNQKSSYSLVFRFMELVLNGDENFSYLSVMLSFARHCVWSSF
eukprot:m.203279 g.203279  ORF g.203279 m.203279 type:complete len:231 (+) comp39620_c2_seq21:759-1451(+)